MEISLPWPPKELSPNARNHWAVIHRAKRIYRTECWAQTKEVSKSLALIGSYKIPLKITFYPPSKRHYDLDNCIASIKAGLDGIADALQVNDHRFALTDVQLSDEVKGMVKVEIVLPY